MVAFKSHARGDYIMEYVTLMIHKPYSDYYGA